MKRIFSHLGLLLALTLPAFADDAHDVDWDAYAPASPPASFGPDTLITLDRIVD